MLVPLTTLVLLHHAALAVAQLPPLEPLVKSDCPQPCSCLVCDQSKYYARIAINCSARGLTAVPQFNMTKYSERFDIDHVVFELNLSNNNITSLDAKSFRSLQLRELNLEGNRLDRLDANSFQAHSSTLRKLFLGHNRFKNVPSNALRGLEMLQNVDLSGNNLCLEADAFKGMPKLDSIKLRQAGVRRIPQGTFAGLTNVDIDLSANDIAYVDACEFVSTIDAPSRRPVMDLTGNTQLVCNCDVFYLARHSGFTLTGAVCSKEPHAFYGGKSIHNLTNEQPDCDYRHFDSRCTPPTNPIIIGLTVLVVILFVGAIAVLACCCRKRKVTYYTAPSSSSHGKAERIPHEEL